MQPQWLDMRSWWGLNRPRARASRAAGLGVTAGLMLLVAPSAALGPGGSVASDGLRERGPDLPRGGSLHARVRHEELDGVRVLGRGLYELVDRRGQVVWSLDRRHPELRGDSLSWNLSPEQAVEIALAKEEGRIPRSASARNPGLARRLIWPLGSGVPIWKVHLPPVLWLVYNPIFYLHAGSGRVLRSENRVWTEGKVRVYAGNPISAPEVREVDIFGLEDGSPGSPLAGPLVSAYNCPDRHELFDVVFMGMQAQVHLCSEVHVALADEQGDFLYDWSNPNDPEDLFAEAHMFYHVMNVYRFFQELGFDHLTQMPLRAVVNFRVPKIMEALSPDGELQPFDNAFYLPAGDIRDIIDRPEDSIVFGQGSRVDFAYDADVIYHEFTHAVVDSTAGLEMSGLDRWGVNLWGGTLHEGYADYFSCALTGDPQVGEYAGQGFNEDGSSIRDISGDHTCPADLIGEVHEDSLPWSEALWQTRNALIEAGSASDAIDQAVLAALMGLPSDAAIEEAASATAAAIRASLGEEAGDLARAIMEERGVLDCARILQGDFKEIMLLPGMGSWNLQNYVPGFLQFAVPAEPEHGLVTVELLLPEPTEFLIPGITGGSAEPWVMLRVGEEPIEIAYEAEGFVVRAVPLVDRMGPMEDMSEGSPRWPHLMRATVAFTPGQHVVHVMVFNRGVGEAFVQQVRLSTAPDPDNPWVGPDEDLGPARPDGGVDGGVEEDDLGAAEGEGEPDAGSDRTDLGGSEGTDSGDGGDAQAGKDGVHPHRDDGCSCRTPALSGPLDGAGAVGALLVMLLGRRQRVRR